jgi:hypothetical protein
MLGKGIARIEGHFLTAAWAFGNSPLHLFRLSQLLALHLDGLSSQSISVRLQGEVEDAHTPSTSLISGLRGH